MNLPEEAYNRGSRDSKFHEKNFLLFYKKFINLNLLKKDRKGYMNILSNLEKMLSGVNFNTTNILFICDEPIDKEVFLHGFSKVEKLKTHYYCNIMKIMDIWWGNCKKDNTNISEDEIMYSEQDIKQDVFCLYIEKDMVAHNMGNTVNSIIASRNNCTNSKGDILQNWIFYKGNMNSLEESNYFGSILNMFKNGNEDFLIVDMNNRGNAQISKGRSVVNTVGKNENNNLSDVY